MISMLHSVRLTLPGIRGLKAGIAAICRQTWQACLLLLAIFLCEPELQAAEAMSEYEVKAAMLFNILKFTEWPESAFANSKNWLVIGIAGADPFGVIMDDLVKGETIRGRAIAIKRFKPEEDVSVCHALWVSRSEWGRLQAVLDSVKNKPVLMICESERFCEKGGMIHLFLSPSGTVKLEVNPEAARAAGLKFSSKLLNLPMVRLIKTEF